VGHAMKKARFDMSGDRRRSSPSLEPRNLRQIIHPSFNAPLDTIKNVIEIHNFFSEKAKNNIWKGFYPCEYLFFSLATLSSLLLGHA
jgi:hypothetical protein